jgi:hypothetical protein
MKRPASVTVFGILNIVFAGLGLFGLLATIALFSMPANSDNPVLKIMQDNPGYASWLKISVILGLLSCVALVASGIGLLFLKPWARVLAIAYGIYSIALGILGMVINFVYLVRPMLEQAKAQSGPESAGAMGGVIGGIIGGCIGLIYPILVLVFMTRPNVVAAFRPATPPPLGA